MQESLWFVIGTALFPIVQLIYPDLRKYFTDRIQAKKIIGENLDPILKTADELYSKIYDLAKTDFKAVYNKNIQSGGPDITERIYILYLFASFFGRISVLRQKNHYSQVAKVKLGKRLLKFLMSFESKTNTRMINRASQRLIGDAMIKSSGENAQLFTLYEFNNMVLDQSSSFYSVIEELDELLRMSFKRDVRQKILYFGILIKAFIDYFDSRNSITKKRQTIFTNKLALKTKFELKFKLFEIYLKFIDRPERYYQ